MIGFTYFSAAIYPWLYFLNLYWFYKMIKGVIEFFTESAESEIDAKNP